MLGETSLCLKVIVPIPCPQASGNMVESKRAWRPSAAAFATSFNAPFLAVNVESRARCEENPGDLFPMHVAGDLQNVAVGTSVNIRFFVEDKVVA